MSFKWLNKQGVESDKGFVVQCMSRFITEYREGLRKITIETQEGFKDGKNCDIISPDSFARWDNGIPISPDKQKEILQNYKDAMAFQNMGVIVDG